MSEFDSSSLATCATLNSRFGNDLTHRLGLLAQFEIRVLKWIYQTIGQLSPKSQVSTKTHNFLKNKIWQRMLKSGMSSRLDCQCLS